MKRIGGILARNRIYFLLIIFIVALNAADMRFSGQSPFSGDNTNVTSSSEDVSAHTGKNTPGIFSPDRIREREEAVKRLFQKDPELYLFIALLNLTVIFLIFLGVLLDLYLLSRKLRKKNINLRVIPRKEPLWNIADVVRVVIIFLALGSLFVFLQGFLSGKCILIKNRNFAMVFNTTVINIAAISVIFHFVVKKYGQSIKALGLTLTKSMKTAFVAVVGYIALLPVIVAVLMVTFLFLRMIDYTPPVQPIVQVFIEEKQTSILWFSAIFAAFFGPVAEEIFFRGFVYPAVRKISGAFWGIFITSVIFAALHQHAVGFFPIFFLGMLLAYLYEKTGSLVSSITVHVIHNLAMVCMVFVVKKLGIY